MVKLYTSGSSLNECSVFEASTLDEAAHKSGYDGNEWKAIGEHMVNGDCWAKFYHAPTQGDLENLIVLRASGTRLTADDLSVLSPGQHPGGRAWWVNIASRDVYAVEAAEIA